MKVYGSGPSDDTISFNGYGGETDNDEPLDPDDEDYSEEDAREKADYSALFGAPNYAEFIKTSPNSNARRYERRVQSLMKAGMIYSLNAGQWPDAATFLKHGPGVAKAAGNLAAEDEHFARIVDMLTAPDSPWVTFAMVAFPFAAQIARNHKAQVEEATKTRAQRRADRKAAKARGEKPQATGKPITVRLGKKRFTLPIRLTVKLPSLTKIAQAFMAPSEYPDVVAAEVFNDPRVVRELNKMGIYPMRREDVA